MIIQRNFTKRANDINDIYLLISFIANVESHRNQPIINADNGEIFFVTQEIQCALKAQFLIFLYNIIESTVCDCLNAVYDSIADDKLTFAELSNEMRAMWKSNLKRKDSNFSKSDADLMDMTVHFDSIAVNISGSLDMRKIIDVFSKHGCKLNETNRGKYSNSFFVVKTKRNDLAHGKVSFSECGSNYIVSDLQRFKEDILNGMQEVVTQVKEYISNRSYKREG